MNFNFFQNKVKEDKNESTHINDNFHMLLKKIEELYFYPDNKELIKRKFSIPIYEKEAVIFYLDSMVNGEKIERSILRPLTEKSKEKDALKDFVESGLTTQKFSQITTMNEVLNSINSGLTVLFVDGINVGYSIDTVGYAHRAIGKPQNEAVIKGPHEAFIESTKINRSLIRKQMKDENLITENIVVGKRVKNYVTMLYVKDIVNPSLVESVKDRLSHIDVDIVQNLELLEQYIEERSFSLVPSVLYTERPDRAVSFLSEGHVVLLMDDSATSIIVPVTYWSLLHSSEDSYLRFLYGNFVRLIRFFATFIALLTPAIYIALTLYHVEMIPTDLMLAIAATREQVPFPVVIELLVMELSFEILREAGIRIPAPMGATIGIVGALILGQAAVDANVISPIMVIVVSITGLSSFAIPDVSLSYMVRIMRFIFTFAAAVMGIFGIVTAMAMIFAYMASIKSFGVPFFSPVAPYYKSSADTLFRLPTWREYLRPGFLKTLDKERKAETRKGYKP